MSSRSSGSPPLTIGLNTCKQVTVLQHGHAKIRQPQLPKFYLLCRNLLVVKLLDHVFRQLEVYRVHLIPAAALVPSIVILSFGLDKTFPVNVYFTRFLHWSLRQRVTVLLAGALQLPSSILTGGHRWTQDTGGHRWGSTYTNTN